MKLSTVLALVLAAAQVPTSPPRPSPAWTTLVAESVPETPGFRLWLGLKNNADVPRVVCVSRFHWESTSGASVSEGVDTCSSWGSTSLVLPGDSFFYSRRFPEMRSGEILELVQDLRTWAPNESVPSVLGKAERVATTWRKR